jgi:hypothetical protein
MFPAAPLAIESGDNGVVNRYFDTDSDGRADFFERLDASGHVVSLHFDEDRADGFELEAFPPKTSQGDVPRLIIILDSVPYHLVKQMRSEGRFAYFYPPTRIVSPFPVMTDLCLADLFGDPPCDAVESQYFDGRRLNSGYGSYAREENSAWLAHTDYHLPFVAHGLAYTWPLPWYGHELRRIQESFLKNLDQPFVGYVVGTSAIGSRLGRDGHLAALVQLDRFCSWIIHRLRGRVQITLMSDHGHNLVPGQRIELQERLREFGYRVRSSLERPDDVVVPEFGIVTCAAVHTKKPAQVARDLATVTGVDLTAYRQDTGDVVVVHGTDTARLARRGNRYRYDTGSGDPLKLRPILERLNSEGKVDADGFVNDAVLLATTQDHVYPDVVRRLWRAFDGLVAHTPDVLVSLEDGYYCGSSSMSDWLDLQAAHGNLLMLSSSGYVMSTAGQLGPVIRMDALGDALRSAGVPLPGGNGSSPSVAVTVRPLPPAIGDGVVK